jgi:hypothetical protein
MYERLERLSETLPRPTLGEQRLNDVVDQHVRNAHRLRAEAFKCHAIAVGKLIRALGQPLGRLRAAIASWFRDCLTTYSHRRSEFGPQG